MRELRQRLPSVPSSRVFTLNLEHGITLPPGLDRLDLIVHWGVLYHLDNWRKSVRDAVELADFVTLETEVCDSDDPEFELKFAERGYDQALDGTGSRPSPAMVEAFLRDTGSVFDRVIDDRCNSGFHRYDWPIANTRELLMVFAGFGFWAAMARALTCFSRGCVVERIDAPVVMNSKHSGLRDTM